MAAFSGVPRSDDEVGLLINGRTAGWEYMLYAGVLAIGMQRLEQKYVDYSLGYAPRLGSMVSRAEFMDFIMAQLSDLMVMVDSLTKVFTGEVLEDALGAPGDGGDPDRIVHAASRAVRLYEDMLLWAERIRGHAMRPQQRRVAEMLVLFADQPINELRAFAQRLTARVDELPAALAAGGDEPFTIHLRLQIQFRTHS